MMSNKHMLLHTSPSVNSDRGSSPFGEVETRCRQAPRMGGENMDYSQKHALNLVLNHHDAASLPI